MTRVLLAAMTLIALLADSPTKEPKHQLKVPQKGVSEPESVDSHTEGSNLQLKVRAMVAPKPALKYQLLPEVREMNPGNPAQYYVRCFAEQRSFFFGKEATAERARYLSLPLAQVPAGMLRNYGGNALLQADWAARLDTLDWQVLQRVQTEGFDIVLPELEPLRVLGTALQVRFRGHVAGRNYDLAAGSAKTMFGLSRHLGEYPTEAANQLGITIALQALATLEEMVQQPGCPNLYWALTDLPCPLVDLRKGVQGERALIGGELQSLRDDAVMTEADIEKVISRLSGVLGFAREQNGQSPRNIRSVLQTYLKDPERIRSARHRLVEAGVSVVLVWWQIRPMQLILLDEKHDFDVRCDEDLKLLSLAPWQIDALAKSTGATPNHEGLFHDLLPHLAPLRRAQARLEQRIGLLRHVEALRLYAASHDGRLPEKLADIPWPLPDDPFTGKPFVYSVKATTAHLQGSPPRSDEKIGRYNAGYEVTFVK